MRKAAIGLPLLLAVALFVALSRRPRPPSPAPPSPAEWTGSDACAACHGEIHARWSKSAHANTLRDFSPHTTARPFDGDRFVARDIEHTLGPGASMECEGPGGELKRFPVEMVIGVRRVQMFTTTLEGGKIQVLPVFLEVGRSKWFDYADFIFGGPARLEIPPDSPDSWYTFARNFNSRCGHCHATNYETGYDPDSGTYETTWAERTVGCESCHGPGGAHAAHWREMRAGRDPIVHPAKLPLDRQHQICGQCHAEGEVIVPGFRPGEDLFAFVDVAGLEDRKHLHPDGRANELIHNLVPILQSRCGPLACTTCHDPHGRGIPGDLYRPLSDDWTCTQCHEEQGAAIEEHTHHARASEGSRCVHCHMPRMVIEGGHGRVFDHTISIPSPRTSRRLGLPNACADCHLTDPIGFEVEPFERWYPGAEERNHRGALALAIHAGRTGAADAEGLLTPYLADKNPVYRAGAARLLARGQGDLRPLLADPNALVRRAAIDGVAARHPDALIPLLEDPNMVIRYRAARALVDRADLREKLTLLFEGFTALKNDREIDHFLLGRLYEAGGRIPEAIAAYERYLRLWPFDTVTRAHVARRRAGGG